MKFKTPNKKILAAAIAAVGLGGCAAHYPLTAGGSERDVIVSRDCTRVGDHYVCPPGLWAAKTAGLPAPPKPRSGIVPI